MMWSAMDDRRLAKILVKRDENTLLATRNFENLGIAWITPNAGIEQ
jgi:hypothetical protein